jgi:hypothetical protein
VPELQRLAISSNASWLNEILVDIGKITGKLVRRWWNQHGLLYCMKCLKDGSVLGATACFPRDPLDPQLSLSPIDGWPNRASESDSGGYAQSICDGALR